MHRSRYIFLAAALTLLAAAPSAFALGEQPDSATPGTSPAVYSPDRVIVQWVSSANHSAKVEAREDADVDFQSDLGNRVFQLVETEPGQTPSEAVAELEADPAVLVAERDGYRSLDSVPNDPLFGQLWGLRNLGTGINGFADAIQGVDVNATAAWDRSVGTNTTVIADIDSGYRFDDPDLGPVAWTNPGEIAGNGLDDDVNGLVDDVRGYDFVGSSSTTPTSDNDPTDDNLISGGHGLHTAGTMGAAGNNGVGITGVAQNVRIMPLRVCANQPSTNEARCPFSSILAAINYAGNKGARAANMSLGGNTFTQTEVNAIALHPLTLYVISAGNDGGDNDGGGAAPKGHHYPCDYRPTVDASPPGVVDNIICVAATDQADGLAGFSDYGATSVDLGAPGTSTLSTYSAQEVPLNDDFEVSNFASKWSVAGGGFGRVGVGDGPLTSFGITDSPGVTPTASTTYETQQTLGTALPAGTGGCAIRGLRFRKGGSFTYGLFVDGVEKPFVSSETAGSSMTSFSTVPITGLGGHSIKFFFRYMSDSNPASMPIEGVWLDNMRLTCYAPITAPLSYEFLDGTSMAAPHVTGAAGLLFSLKPTATVTQVRSALLAGADRIPALAGKTVSGGRLDIPHAMDALEGLPVDNLPPAAPLLTSTLPASPANNASPAIVGSAEAGSSVRVHLGPSCKGSPTATGTAAGLASPGIGVNVPNGVTSQFSARAVDAAGNISPCSTPISYTNSTPVETPVIKMPPAEIPSQQNPPACKVPALAGKSLAEAKAALSAANCTLGKVTKPKAKKGKKLPALVVKSSTPAAGASPASGKVDLKLGKKPKPKKKHH